MARFRSQPVIGKTAKAFNAPSANNMTKEVNSFRSTYILERRFLQFYREGDVSTYSPADSVDGKSKWSTPEVKANKNVWNSVFSKLKPLFANPARYLELLFTAIRDSSVPVPTPSQLASSANLDYYSDFEKSWESQLHSKLSSGLQNLSSKITCAKPSNDEELCKAVYACLNDSNLTSSYLLRYCVGISYLKDLKTKSVDKRFIDAIRSVCKRSYIPAAKEYCVFPDDYKRIWGDMLPKRLRKSAREDVQDFLGVRYEVK